MRFMKLTFWENNTLCGGPKPRQVRIPAESVVSIQEGTYRKENGGEPVSFVLGTRIAWHTGDGHSVLEITVIQKLEEVETAMHPAHTFGQQL